MATRLNLNPSLKFTDASLHSFFKQGEAACLTLQSDLDEGYFSLTEAVTKIGSFTEKVRSMGKKYQEEKQTATSRNMLQMFYTGFLEEYRGYKATDLKTVILFENIEKTMRFIQPAHRSRSDEKSLQENLPDYYLELKEYEAIFTRHISQIKSAKALLSPLKHTLSAAINSKALTTALDKFRTIAENQETRPSRSSRIFNHITPSIIVEKAPLLPAPPSKSKSDSSWKTLPLSRIIHHQTTDELLTPPSHNRKSSEELISLSPRDGQGSSWESLSHSSPRRELTPQKRAVTSSLQPLIREAARNPGRTALLNLSGSGGNPPYRTSHSSREGFTRLSASSSPRSAYESPRRLHLPSNPLRHRKSYDNADSTPLSRTRY